MLDVSCACPNERVIHRRGDGLKQGDLLANVPVQHSALRGPQERRPTRTEAGGQLAGLSPHEPDGRAPLPVASRLEARYALQWDRVLHGPATTTASGVIVTRQCRTPPVSRADTYAIGIYKIRPSSKAADPPVADAATLANADRAIVVARRPQTPP